MLGTISSKFDLTGSGSRVSPKCRLTYCIEGVIKVHSMAFTMLLPNLNTVGFPHPDTSPKF